MFNIQFKLDGVEAGEARSAVVPRIDEDVIIEHNLRGVSRGKVIAVHYRYTDTGIRRVDVYSLGSVVVYLESL